MVERPIDDTHRFRDDDDIFRAVGETIRNWNEVFLIDFRLRNLVWFGVRIPHAGADSASQELGTQLMQELWPARDGVGRAGNEDGCAFIDVHIAYSPLQSI